jgi:prophage regulatory protein
MAKQASQNCNSLLKISTVKFRTGLSKSTIYRRINEGLFVKQVNLGGRQVAFPSNEIDALVQARISGKTDEEIKALVVELHGKRNEENTFG